MAIVNKQKILVVDDSEMNRAILTDILGDDYDILEARDGEEGVEILRNHVLDIGLILLDIVMPNMDGFEVLHMMQRYHWIDTTPVIMISAETASEQVTRAFELGVTDFISRPFDAEIVHRRVINTMLLYTKQRNLERLIADQIYERAHNNNLMIEILSNIVEFRNGESGAHVRHIRRITDILLRTLSRKEQKYHLTEEEITTISTASALHDIGKIAIDDAILNKPGKLTDGEFAIMKTHSLKGAEMLENIPARKEEPLMRAAYEITRWHHERYDGRGYPDGLKGDAIPIAAQVVSIADVYDALTSERVYKKAFTHEKAIDMISNGECGTFNPLMLECLLESADEIIEALKDKMDTEWVKQEVTYITKELHSHGVLSASERTLQLLEHERMKYNFFADMTDEIQFEYTRDPSMVTITSLGAEKLGLPPVIANPTKMEEVKVLMAKKDWDSIADLLHATSASHPIVKTECMMNIQGEERKVNIVARATWSQEEPPRYEGALGKVIDVHDTYVKLTSLEHEASHDALTGLLNHKTARQCIEARLADRPEGHHALLLLDMDHFKSANDTYGHEFGDRVLIYLANRMRNTVCSGDIVARMGGDEFLIFIECKDDIEPGVRRIYNALLSKYEDFPINISMGVASVDKLGTDYQTLFNAADKALYTIKRNGRGRYQVYDESMEEVLTKERDT